MAVTASAPLYQTIAFMLFEVALRHGIDACMALHIIILVNDFTFACSSKRSSASYNSYFFSRRYIYPAFPLLVMLHRVMDFPARHDRAPLSSHDRPNTTGPLRGRQTGAPFRVDHFRSSCSFAIALPAKGAWEDLELGALNGEEMSFANRLLRVFLSG